MAGRPPHSGRRDGEASPSERQGQQSGSTPGQYPLSQEHSNLHRMIRDFLVLDWSNTKLELFLDDLQKFGILDLLVMSSDGEQVINLLSPISETFSSIYDQKLYMESQVSELQEKLSSLEGSSYAADSKEVPGASIRTQDVNEKIREYEASRALSELKTRSPVEKVEAARVLRIWKEIRNNQNNSTEACPRAPKRQRSRRNINKNESALRTRSLVEKVEAARFLRIRKEIWNIRNNTTETWPQALKRQRSRRINIKKGAWADLYVFESSILRRRHRDN